MRRKALIIITTATVLLAATGCGSGGPGAVSDTTGRPVLGTTTSVAPTDDRPVSDPTSKADHACTYLTVRDVSVVLGDGATGGGPDEPTLEGTKCTWRPKGSLGGSALELVIGNGAGAYDRTLASGVPEETPEPVGEDSYLLDVGVQISVGFMLDGRSVVLSARLLDIAAADLLEAARIVELGLRDSTHSGAWEKPNLFIGDPNALPQGYGDDSTLDALWDTCDAGEDSSCDQLWFDSVPGSVYESFGGGCGGRAERADGACVTRAPSRTGT